MGRLFALIEWLPLDSAARRTLGIAWSEQLELAATTVEMLHAQYRAFLSANGVKHPPDALRLPRPGDRDQREEEQRSATRADYRRALMGGDPT